MKLTKVQSKTLEIVNTYIKEHGSPPTFREIGEMRKSAGMGGNPVSAFHTISQLRMKGLIEFSGGKHRSITPIKTG